jgi:hypothetical protein
MGRPLQRIERDRSRCEDACAAAADQATRVAAKQRCADRVTR